MITTTIKSDVNAVLDGQAISYQITSGPGTLSAVTAATTSTSSTAAGRLVSATALALASDDITSVTVIGDGTAGTTVITVTAGNGTDATLIATHTMYFVGAASTYTPVVAYNTLAVGANSAGSSTDYVIAVLVKDSNGNKVVNGTTVYAASSDALTAAIATSATTTSGYAFFDVQGVKAGSGVTLTFRNASTAATSTVTATSTAVAVTTSTFNSATAGAVMSFNKTSYEPGEKMTLMITYKGAGGAVLADNGGTGYVGMFGAAATSNVALQGSLPGVDAYPTDGVEEFTLYAPSLPGTVTVTSGKVTAASNPLYLTRLTATATVASTAANPTLDAATAANDAAAEATDAANAATDAANAAAEAADAATAAAQDAADAVAALSAQVATLISGLKAQLTALTNLVIKIQKKVKA